MIWFIISDKNYHAELERVKGQIRLVSEQIKGLEKEEKEYLKRVDLLERKVVLLENYLNKLKKQENSLKTRLRFTERRLESLNKEKVNVSTKIKKGLNLLLILKKPSVWEFIFNPRKAYAYYERAVITESLIYAYKNSLEQVVGFEREYMELRKRKKELLDEITSNIEEQERALEDLKDTRNKLSKEIEGIRKSKTKKEEYLGRLEERKAKLESIIRKLAKEEKYHKELPTGKILLWPTRGRVVRKFGYYTDPKYGVKIKNNGIDILAPPGSDVVASTGGKVVYAGYLEGYGNVVIIEGKGFYIIHGNLMDITVGVDKVVREGMKIGTTGSKPLHFEVREGTKPVDPLEYLP